MTEDLFSANLGRNVKNLQFKFPQSTKLKKFNEINTNEHKNGHNNIIEVMIGIQLTG